MFFTEHYVIVAGFDLVLLIWNKLNGALELNARHDWAQASLTPLV